MENDRELLAMVTSHEALATKCAHILGPSSAAQAALDEATRVRAAGGACVVVLTEGSWIVVRAAAEIGRAMP